MRGAAALVEIVTSYELLVTRSISSDGWATEAQRHGEEERCSLVFLSVIRCLCGQNQNSNTCIRLFPASTAITRPRLSIATAQGYANWPGSRPAAPQISRPLPVRGSIFCTRLLPNSHTIRLPSPSMSSPYGNRNSPGPEPTLPILRTNVPSVLKTQMRCPPHASVTYSVSPTITIDCGRENCPLPKPKLPISYK